ncbi:MAG: aconitase/3-isopropylmalate dehydratase large subunit family protein [bacterium]
MGQTMIEKIFTNHSSKKITAGDIAEISIDARIARDFGGANVVKNIQSHNLAIDDPQKTFFTFDCNPGGSDQQYAENQHICRQFSRERGIKVYDIQSGIGTHIAIDEGLVRPGGTLVSTDSHANILGSIGAFGQGMGDRDIAAVWSEGKIWFKTPETVKLLFHGTPPDEICAKDIVLFLLKNLGAAGLLGKAAELEGDYIQTLSLNSRITISSMATEMGGIIALFAPNKDVLDHFKEATGEEIEPVYADKDARYVAVKECDLSKMEPLTSLPGHPEDVVKVTDLKEVKIDSAFIGSCTNGRLSDMQAAANILKNRKVAPGVVLKIVPSTRKIWEQCLEQGIIDIFMKAGALVGNAGCAGCAKGQIGQNGPGEITISTGNRNFAGKQGKGEVYLASPETVAASAVSGIITSKNNILSSPKRYKTADYTKSEKKVSSPKTEKKPVEIQGRVWVVDQDNIDTDMIFHNRYLTITDVDEMGQYTFDNLKGWEDFSDKAEKGDIIATGSNFGAGSSRQQAVDCFKSLGIQAIIAKSFGAIYERNGVNSGFPLISGDLISSGIESGEEIKVNFKTGEITRLKTGETIQAQPFSDVQMDIYQKGDLLRK